MPRGRPLNCVAPIQWQHMHKLSVAAGAHRAGLPRKACAAAIAQTGGNSTQESAMLWHQSSSTRHKDFLA